jgi:mRNA-degrading endonuclease RelE of RelBE toxin-antitoxin system
MFFATSDFVNSYSDLKSHEKHYSNIGTDIYNLFVNKSINDIFELQQFIDNKPPNYRVIKCRIANSKMNVAENAGYRLYYNILKHKNIICLLYIYPKTGKRQSLAINDTYAKSLTTNFATEYKLDKLFSIELDSSTRSIIVK